MADQELSQPPFKAAPATFHDECVQALDTIAVARGCWPASNHAAPCIASLLASTVAAREIHDMVPGASGHRAGLKAERGKQIFNLACVLGKYPQYAKACSYYGYLLNMPLQGPTEILHLLQARPRRLVQDRPLVREPIPGLEGHNLRVAFTRRR